VHVEQRQLRLLHPVAHALVAFGLLRALEGRGVDRQEQLRTGRLRLGRGLREPEVLADRERELAALDLEHARPVAGVEVALLVEDGVVREPLLEVDVLDASAAQDRRGVVARAPLAVGVAHHDGHVGAVGREANQLRGALVAEIVAQPQVLGGVAGERHLGCDDQLRPARARRVHRSPDALRVAGEVAHGDVDLGDGDFHVMIFRVAALRR
jgi:hypothetical protein